MSATTAAVLQISAAATVAGVSLAVVAYLTGVDRAVRHGVYAVAGIVRHPLVSFELGAAMIMSVFPAPKRRARHRAVV